MSWLWRRRVFFLALAFCLAGLGYAGLIVLVLQEPSDSKGASNKVRVPAPPIHLYAELIAVDPVRSALDFRLDFATQSTSVGPVYGGQADRDTVIQLASGDLVRRLTLHSGRLVESRNVSIDISRGSVWQFPFDRYTAALTISIYPGPEHTEEKLRPFQLKMWERLPAWKLDANIIKPSDEVHGLALSARVRRPILHVIFATALYAATSVLGITAITIGAMMFVGSRKMDSTFAAGPAAMLFTIPSLRRLMPGAPPLGVAADVIVLLAAELAAIASLALVIFTWATRRQEHCLAMPPGYGSFGRRLRGACNCSGA